MQILSISGENIASLAEPFAIKLDEAPLASAGLFAITGDTGAGKSSILDALCLALYGNCPRLSGDGTRENIEDVDGQELKSTDPRMALRRGAAKAIARVVFRAVDGEVYAAEWMVRRAREKLEGRLQNVERVLIRVSDETVLATQPTIVNEHIVSLSGLNYDEFRRTILLAQGEFDAFLVAKTAERAAILEKVTGTEIYRDISKKVYERHLLARRTLETLEARRGEHRPLGPEDRQVLIDDIAALRSSQSDSDNELKQVVEGIAAHVAYANTLADFEKAQLRLAAAQLSVDSRREDKIWLQEWKSARELRGEAKEQQAAARASADAKVEYDAQIVLRDDQIKAVEIASKAVEAAYADRELAETTFKSFAADWTRATTLDGNIAIAREESNRAADLANITSARVSEARVKFVELRAQKETIEATIRAEIAKLAEVSGHEALLENWPLLDSALQDRIDFATDLKIWEEEKTFLSTSIYDDQEKLKNCAAAVDTASQLIRTAQIKQDDISDELSALTEANPVERLALLSQVVGDLRDFRNARSDVCTARDAIAKSKKRISDAEVAQTEASELKVLAEKKAAEAGHIIRTLQRPVESAKAALTAEAAQLRQHLQDGQPCPVCRSISHPVMEDDKLAELAKSLGRELDAALKMQQAAMAEVKQTEDADKGARKILAEEAAAQPRLNTEHDRAIQKFEAIRQILLNSPVSFKLPSDPAAAEDDFEGLSDTVASLRRELEVSRDRLHDLNKSHATATRMIEEQSREIMRLNSEERELSQCIAGSRQRIATLEESITSAGKSIRQVDARIGPILVEARLSIESFGPGSEHSLVALREVSKRLFAARKKTAEQQSLLVAIEPKLARSDADLVAATKAEADAKRDSDSRANSLNMLVQEREQLLGGEATDTHRTRINETRTKAQSALEAATHIHSSENAALSGVASSLDAAEAAMLSAEKRLLHANAALKDACLAAQLSLERALELHQVTDEMVADVRERIRFAETEKANAEGALSERQAAFKLRQESWLPETSKEDLANRRVELETASKTRAEELGRLLERQSSDAEAHERLKDLEKEISSAQEIFDTWLALSDAIGAASGDKFAQIAQALTLQLLAEKANEHLRELKPRYQLDGATSDLALHVIDLDMADDRRATRSLSGGERFLVSLALALALSSMGTHGALAGTLFIDEGFGSLDADSLDLAIDALERLQAQGRTIGVISHVQAMKDRIPVQIEVAKMGGGASELKLKVA